MALKKKATKVQEQLYMLEVMIDGITLNPERGVSEDLIVRVRFTDLPECEISVPNKNIEKEDASPNEFGYGKTCLFSKTPSCLIRAMRWSPLYLDAYRLEPTCPTKENQTFLGTARISLPTCMCNHVAKTQKESTPTSTPCVVKKTFDLIGSESETIGRVSVVLRLSCFGSSIVKQFSLNEKSFVLEDSPLQKFLCPYLTPEGKKDPKDENEPLLKRPDSPPRISMDDPAFKTLTSAEKLNDPKYRELVYKTYPDQPTCCCLPPNRTTHPMKCRSGCTRPCCMKLRNPKILDTQKDRHVDDALANTYCVNKPLRLLDQYTPRSNQSRLRGGADVEQLYIGPSTIRWNDDADYSWYKEKPNQESRMEGGGEIQFSSCSCSGSPTAVPLRSTSSKDRDVVTTFDACQPRITSTGPKPTCPCPGKEASSWPRGAARCMNKPCMGIDCLIRAFEEAQEFVNSIGKVPGMRGLGLMDPSESPYFGRDIDKDYVTQEPEAQKKKPGAQQRADAPRCTAPCSLNMGRPDDGQARIGAPYTPTATVGLPIPPRLGIVREAIPVLPEVASVAGTGKHKKAHEKRDEKTDKFDPKVPPLTDTEVGPCGEPKCKSRRKKPADTMSLNQSENITFRMKADVKKPKSRNRKKKEKGKRGRRENNPQSSALSKTGMKVGGSGLQGKIDPRDSEKMMRKMGPVGPGGDLYSGMPLNVSRKVMRYVYFVGDYYPGIVYGHKDCIQIPMRVPANMGWLWNTMTTAGKLKPRIGWKPGAIGRYLYEMLQEAKEISMERSRIGPERTRSAPSRGRASPRRRDDKTRGFQTIQQMKMEGEDEDIEAPPTLHIHRKDGTYYVTMYPIKQETPGEPRVTEPSKPLQFKIVKNKDDASVASSSTASDMEIEFSPPAAVSRYRKKPDVVHIDTQVRQQEILDAVRVDTTRKGGRRKHDPVESKMDSAKKKDKKEDEAAKKDKMKKDKKGKK
nr:PREDICTED: uncharacterized protein LOC105662069 [Megachile rotundata]